MILRSPNELLGMVEQPARLGEFGLELRLVRSRDPRIAEQALQLADAINQAILRIPYPVQLVPWRAGRLGRHHLAAQLPARSVEVPVGS